MKTALKLIALFSLAGLSGAAAAESAGLPVASLFNVEAGISLFATALALLVFGADYTRRPAVETPRRRVGLLPAAEAFRSAVPVRVAARSSRRVAALVTAA